MGFKMKNLIYNILSSLILSLWLISCNHEVFVKPLTVEPMTHTIEWTGGEGVFKANQPITYVGITAFRWVEGHARPLGDNGMQFGLHGAGTKETIDNEVCHIAMNLTPEGELVITSDTNLYADTVYLNLDVYVNYEKVERGLRILPNPGFGHGEIDYKLTSWWENERTDTIMLAQIAMGDNTFDYTLKKKGDVLAKRAGQFKPYEKVLSDNIFGREPFSVRSVEIKDRGSWLEPVMSDEKIIYSSAVQHFENDPLLYDEDVVVKLEPKKWYKIRAIIKGIQLGIEYNLDAISPIKTVENRTIQGVYWYSIPTSYAIDIESVGSQ